MPAVLSIISDRVKFSQFRLTASIASGLIFPSRLRAGIRLHSLIRALEPSSLAAQDSVQSHTRSHRPGSRRTKPAKTHYTTSFIKSHTHTFATFLTTTHAGGRISQTPSHQENRPSSFSFDCVCAHQPTPHTKSKRTTVQVAVSAHGKEVSFQCRHRPILLSTLRLARLYQK
jgi:hypothetical protein